MKRRHLQRGVALIATMALVMMGGSAYLISRLKASSASYTVANKAHNTRVLRQAKDALIGWVANQAAKTGETNPGRLVCPEGTAYTGVDGVEGYSAPGLQSAGGVTYNAPTCASIGRFPWRSVGTMQLLDANSEPLWYVVGPTWRMSSTSSYTNINSNTKGDITYGATYLATTAAGNTVVSGLSTQQTAGMSVGMKVAGTGIASGTSISAVGSTSVTLSAAATASGTAALTFGEDAVALIIAPGAAIDAQTATGCTARTQGRSTPSSSINYADYLECYDATTLQFTSNGGSSASNDQMMIITAAELMPAIEAAVAARIEREVVPVLKAVYTSRAWPLLRASGPLLAPNRPLFAFAAPFSDPGTSNFLGAAGTYQGLLPFNFSSAGFTNNSSAVAVATLVQTGGSGTVTPTVPCTLNASLRWRCSGNYRNGPSGTTQTQLRMTVTVPNAAMALRDLDQTKLVVRYRPGATGSYLTYPCSNCLTAAFRTDGAADVYADVTLPLSGANTYYYRIDISNSPLVDHAILDSSSATTGWFVRNEWYRLVYYAVAQGLTATALPTPACATGTSCLTLNRAVTGATNTSPIVVTVPSHGLTNGAQATLSGIAGNTAANGTRTITYIDANTFSLNGSAGNGNYTHGGTLAQTNKRALLVLAGRSLSSASRPNATLADYLEFGNAAGATTFEQYPVTPPPKAIATDTSVSGSQYNVSAYPRANGTPLFIKAANTNTGGANLYAADGQLRGIFNLDGTTLAASQIRANAVVQITFDGNYHYLSKKPFNDRVIVLDSN